ncbi:MAG: SUMF1/EgtB/PvdO family nonheme iron enzyme, partial [Bdellovibrionaceae bacterium]|nr:SUMF1/EgtB/PvdO family nonheme iron enzyme [Pseudobdellovibrionaceae bacterium]
ANCYGSGTNPVNTIGVPGNVYYRTDTGSCFVKKSDNTWTDANQTLTTIQRSSIVTNEPTAQGGYRPPLVNINQANANATCNAMVDSTYGAKRLLRKREFTAAAGFAKYQGEPNYLDDTAIATLETGSTTGAHTSLYQCNSSNHTGITAGAFKSTKLAGDAGDAVKSFTIGSLETSNCVSRFGAQDMVGNVWEWNSDQAYCNSSASAISTPYSLGAYACIGTASAIDSGNGYSSGFDMNGFMFDGFQGPGGSNLVSEWNFQDLNFSANYFNVPMALPLVGNDNGNAIGIAANSAKLHGDRFWLYTGNGSSRGLFSGGNWYNGSNNGRWTTNWSNSPSNAINHLGFRCALPAE